jgi:N-acetylmuramoyl-L-alanine amidase
MNNLFPSKNGSKVILMIFLVAISIIGSSQPLNEELMPKEIEQIEVRSAEMPPVELFKKNEVKVVVIDAGHGGKDPGCSGHSGSQEKHIALEIALKLGKLIEDSLPGVKVVYTRTTDKFVELWQRAAIAHQNKADLFISIHCNAHTNANLHGVETYVMGLHKSNGNLSVSMRENNALNFEMDYKESGHYTNFDPNSPEAHIILSLYQNAYLDYSIELAGNIQKNVKKRGVLHDLGVKQAGFVVLWQTTMPSVLVETGYLTNFNNEKYLTSEKGKLESASNIFEAVKDFKLSLERKTE